MKAVKTIMPVTWLVVLLSGSCFGPRTYSQPASPGGSSAQIWTVLAGDLKGDARDQSLADAAQLAYQYDKQNDMLWFRLALYSTPNKQAFGFNIVIDTGGDDTTKLSWWGGNKAFKFDRLITGWVTHSDGGYQGTIGVSDASGIAKKQFDNLHRNNLQIRIEGDALVVGVKRTDITDKMKMNLIAAVGSNQQWNDDVPNFASSALDLSADRPKRGLREIDLARNNFEFATGDKILPDNQPPLITQKGRGKQTLILVPGMYSGKKSFENFITRNQSRYKFYLVTPPGINGTPARAMPPADSGFGELSWTRRLERDILDLISKRKLARPVIVAESYPASIAAVELAVAHPDKIAGVVIAGTNLVQFFPSPKDPTRKTQMTLAERVVTVDEAWGAKWFKYVTPETWNSNDMRPEMLAADPTQGNLASEEIEAAPLPVKIRYVCEFWAADVTRNLDKLQVPMLVLIAGFDEKFLADPANTFTKLAYVDSWETLVPKHPLIKLVKVPNTRLLMLDDQMGRANDSIAEFVEEVGRQER